ncbi:dynein heavy chain [Pseudozyma hubeiensis SY62]|uniref:Dynein heavy chain n=1 Tax=Pseudozyma hubeiensis (strain SY62) TaxID=1305764 RepID=R9PCZ7_PSEHS|nr:dynein heavy chain [Pseudozyma hubeiensis SY62]GAC99258.1 dynein heavy chain [Pseudozyma hubeiensis SY62]
MHSCRFVPDAAEGTAEKATRLTSSGVTFLRPLAPRIASTVLAMATDRDRARISQVIGADRSDQARSTTAIPTRAVHGLVKMDVNLIRFQHFTRQATPASLEHTSKRTESSRVAPADETSKHRGVLHGKTHSHLRSLVYGVLLAALSLSLCVLLVEQVGSVAHGGAHDLLLEAAALLLLSTAAENRLDGRESIVHNSRRKMCVPSQYVIVAFVERKSKTRVLTLQRFRFGSRSWLRAGC